jgi:hypothetical protein
MGSFYEGLGAGESVPGAGHRPLDPGWLYQIDRFCRIKKNMAQDFDVVQGKTAGDLTREAFWFGIHTILAVLVLAVIVIAFWIARVDSESNTPKILCTFLAFLVPMIVGFIVARARQDRTAKYIWISGLITFSIVCVWVLDLPTGNGLCEGCGPLEKLYRTFFDINHGSGLMGGDGLLVGTWIPLSMIGYALGASFGLGE